MANPAHPLAHLAAPLSPDSDRAYVDPPKPRSDASQALIWSAGFMRPFTPPAHGGRNVECRILVMGEDGQTRPCGATLKHQLGASTTNLLKHIKVKHPDQAARCLENSKHSGVYKQKRMDAGLPMSSRNREVIMRPNKSGGLQQQQGPRRIPGSDPLERRFALYCALDLHPWQTSAELGFLELMGAAPTERITYESFASVLDEERASVEGRIRSMLEAQRLFISTGPCAALQIHTWTQPSCPKVFAALSVSFVTPEYQWQRCGLSVAAFPSLGTDLSGTVEQWVRDVTLDYFDCNEPKDVFVAATLGHGEFLKPAMSSLGIPSLPCSIAVLDKAVRAGLTGPTSGLVSRLVDVGSAFTDADYVSGKDRGNGNGALASGPTASAVSSALGGLVGEVAADPSSLQAVLDLMRRVLKARPLLLAHAQEAPGLPALEPKEWRMLQDAVGVLEACAEVDSGLRSNQPMPLAASIGLVQELRQYLSEEVVFVPDLDKDADVDRLEKPAARLDAMIWQMRELISNKLAEMHLGDANSNPEVLACLLDPCRKSEEIASAISTPEAWSELEDECSRFASATALDLVAKAAAGHASGQSGDAEDSGKRRWKGTLKERKERRISRVSATTVQERQRAELEAYRIMPQLAVEGVNGLLWWAERLKGPDGTDGSINGQQVPASSGSISILPFVAARYHSIDPAASFSSQLFDSHGYRIAGLLAHESLERIKTMLFLRLNKNIILDLSD